LQAHPDHFEAIFLMGLIQQRKGHFQQALTTLEMAVGLKKNSSAAHASLGSLLAAVGQRQQAIKHLNTALKLKPSAPVHFLFGADDIGDERTFMAEERTEKSRALDLAVSQIEKQFGKGSIMRLGGIDSSAALDAISSGSLSLDAALGVGGFPRGRVIEIFGP